jgi:hypothetical protein
VILDELAEANAQLREWVRIGARQAKAGSLEQMDGLEAAWANTPFFLYNAICFTRPVENEEDLNRRLSEATSYAATKQLPWVLFLCPDWLQEPLRERTNEILAAHGLAAASRSTSMVTEELLPPRRPLPKLEYVRIETTEQQMTAAEMNASAYAEPVEPVRALVGTGAVWRNPDREYGFLAYRNGEPVSTSTTTILDQKLYVSWVTTPNSHRRKGYAEAVMRHSLKAARTASGLRRSVLHASEVGSPLYLAMGYRPTGTVLFCLPAAASAH